MIQVTKSMFQITFSEPSINEMNKLDTLAQMDIADALSSISSDDLGNSKSPIGQFNRNGIPHYRLRTGEYRCYFTIQGDILKVEYILNKNTVSDFVFRAKLPMTSDLVLEQDQSFWKYIESLSKDSAKDPE